MLIQANEKEKVVLLYPLTKALAQLVATTAGNNPLERS